MRTPIHTLPFLGPEPEYHHANGFMREEGAMPLVRLVMLPLDVQMAALERDLAEYRRRADEIVRSQENTNGGL